MIRFIVARAAGRRSGPAALRFCLGCGAALSPASPAPAPRTYTPKLAATSILSAGDALKQSAHVTRLLRRLHAHSLIAKIPHSRWRVSLSGRRVPAAAPKLREVACPSLYAAKRKEATEKHSISGFL